MNFLGIMGRPYERGGRALVYGNVEPGVLHQISRIPIRVGQLHVAGRDGDADDLDFRHLRRQKNGSRIIDAGVTVEPYLMPHHRFASPYPATRANSQATNASRSIATAT